MFTTPASNFIARHNSVVEPKTGKSRLAFIDGLRGLAAFYVLIYHASIAIFVPSLFGGAHITGNILDKFLDLFLLALQSFQHYAVVLFIVISGYSLMLSVVRSKEERLPSGSLSFFKRRAIRLLPTYYAALIISLILLLIISSGVLTSEKIITHIFLVQNWFSESIYSIDGPMWSLAVEWQIYFLFPLLLIPIWKRFGSLVTVFIGVSFGLLIQYTFDNSQTYIFAWFIGLFALGMLSASVGFSKRVAESQWKEKIPWGFLTIFFIIILGIIRFLSKNNNFERDINWYKDSVAGLVFCCLLIYLTNQQTNLRRNHKPNIIFVVISSRILAFLGVFSYSIYLFHAPILLLLSTAMEDLKIPEFVSWSLLIFLGVPIALLGSYLCFLVFEKPFIKQLSKSKNPVI